MLLVIFGAGASYDAVPTRPLDKYPDLEDRLPLADELFDDRPMFAARMRMFEKCLDIVPRLHRIAPKNTVEAALEALRAEADTDPERFCQLAAVRFYLQSIIWETDARWKRIAQGITNYRSLIDQIRHWAKPGKQVYFATFNYDTMLESALQNFGLKISDFSHYVNHEVFKVIKLHGSVNWVREIDQIESCIPEFDRIDGGNAAKALIAGAACVKPSDRFRMISSYMVGRIGSMPIFPAIAIPVQSKDEYECPRDHVEALRNFLRSQVTKILIVGWRGSEMPFRELLAQYLQERAVRIMVVGPGANETVTNLRAVGFCGPFTTFDHGFTDFIKEPKAGDKFLAEDQ